MRTAETRWRHPAAAQEGEPETKSHPHRRPLHATPALVNGAQAMPWADRLAIIREDNAFRSGKNLLPPEEGCAIAVGHERITAFRQSRRLL